MKYILKQSDEKGKGGGLAATKKVNHGLVLHGFASNTMPESRITRIFWIARMINLGEEADKKQEQVNAETIERYKKRTQAQ